MKKLLLALSLVLLVSCHVPGGPAVPTTAIDLEDAVGQLDTAQLRIHFIDIGPGLAVLIQTPNNRKNIFIDGGKWGLDEMVAYVKTFVPATKPIDLAIVTHADLDHYEGMRKIFEQFQVGEFWYSGYTSNELGNTQKWQKFLETVSEEEDCVIHNPIGAWKEAGEAIVVDNRNTSAAADDIRIILLKTNSQTPEKDPVSARVFTESLLRNNASLVFKLVYGKTSVLFTGDVNGRDENVSDPNMIDSEELVLWARHTFYGVPYNLTADILQVSHHGSNGASSLPFLKAVNPAYAIITAGHAYDHPRPDTLERLDLLGIETLRTDEGDSTPENDSIKDPRGDDSYIFQTDGQEITKILKVQQL